MMYEDLNLTSTLFNILNIMYLLPNNLNACNVWNTIFFLMQISKTFIYKALTEEIL